MRRIGAENRRRDIIIVIRKNRVLIHLGMALLKAFSSLENPIYFVAAHSVCVLMVGEEREYRERESKMGDERGGEEG